MPANKPLAPAVIAADRKALLALKVSIPGYNPTNAAFTVEAVSMLNEKLRQTEEAEILAGKALAIARDARAAAGRELHDAILGVKAQITSQYGPNSNEIQLIGLKRKSDYRTTGRRAK
jgi:hypothetical protein